MSSCDSFDLVPRKKRHYCDVCEHSYKSAYNLKRHRQEIHCEFDSEHSSNESRSDPDEENDASEHSSDSEERLSDASTDEEEEEEEEDNSAFDRFVNETFSAPEYINLFNETKEALLEEDPDLSNKKASNKARIYLLPQAQKLLKKNITEFIITMFQLKNNNMFNTIMKRIKKYQNEGMEHDEAVKSGVGYWKHSIYKLIDIDEEEEEEKDEEESEEEIDEFGVSNFGAGHVIY